MARRRWHPSANTRKEILEEAERLFMTVGYAKTTIADIAASLGMSSANIFKNFGSKLGLMDALIADRVACMSGKFEVMPESVSAVDQLKIYVRSVYRHHVEKVTSTPIIIEMLIATAFEKFRSHNEFRGRMHNYFVSLVERGIENGEFAKKNPVSTAGALEDALMSVLDPVSVLRQMRFHTTQELDERCEQLLELVIASLRMPLVK
jgi:TetR/AcrR family transcriptional regulator, repressor of the ameABC operon